MAQFQVNSQREVSDFFGVSRSAIKGWLEEGAPRKKKGRSWVYDLSAIARWKIERSQQYATSAAVTEWKDRSQEYNAKLKELELLQKQGELMPTAEIVSDLRELYIEVRTHLMAAKNDLPTSVHDQYEQSERDALARIVADLDARVEAIERKGSHATGKRRTKVSS